MDALVRTDLQSKARMLVANYFNDTRVDAHIPLITLREVHVVWFSKTLKNWKALVTTDIPDGKYYELTYDGNTNEIYLDVYLKVENIAISDHQN